ncbi:MAG: hypothetical protein ACOH2V_07595 [Candidatus Saccharimonadaceae bacterium]
MPQITITRPYQWTNQVLSINIYIDDNQVGSIKAGESKHFEVPSGKHKVFVKNNWTGSQTQEVDMNSYDNKTFRLSSFKYLILMAPIIISAVFIIYYSIKTFFNLEQNKVVDISAMILLYAALFFMFGKKYYWKLEEVGVANNELKIEKAG